MIELISAVTLLGQHVRGRAQDLAGLRPQVRRVAVVIDQRCDAEIEILIRSSPGIAGSATTKLSSGLRARWMMPRVSRRRRERAHLCEPPGLQRRDPAQAQTLGQELADQELHHDLRIVAVSAKNKARCRCPARGCALPRVLRQRTATRSSGSRLPGERCFARHTIPPAGAQPRAIAAEQRAAHEEPPRSPPQEV